MPGAFRGIARFDGVQNLLMLDDHLLYGFGQGYAIEKCQSQPQLGNEDGMKMLQARAPKDVEQHLVEAQVHRHDVSFIPGGHSASKTFNLVLKMRKDLFRPSASFL